MPANKRTSATITTNTNTYIGVAGGEHGGVTLYFSGTFDGATATVGYLAEDGTVETYGSADATGTTDFEVSIQAGQGVKIYVVTSGGGGSLSLDVMMSRW